MPYESAGKLTFEQRLAFQGAMIHVGHPGLSLGPLAEAVGDVGRSRVRALKSFRHLGVDIEPFQIIVLPSDLARGLAVTKTVEILPE